MVKPFEGMRVSPRFHSKVNDIQKEIKEKTNAEMGTIEITDIIAEKIKVNVVNEKINEINVKYDFKVRRKQFHSIFDF